MMKEMTIAERRANYAEWARKNKESKYRREREYAGYVDRFLHSEESVDGTPAKDRKDKLPMPYNMYFG